ncbi:MAG: hypothetical protein HY908_23595 [Myxococcales bacterium]|nr:hypothetical protein [Myxococcales bacterium]
MPFRTFLQRAVDPAQVAAARQAPPPALPLPPEPPDAARPSPGPVQPGHALPDLSVEQCAALFAECATFPDMRAAAGVRFGLVDEAALRALELAWRERFVREPQLFPRWHALYAHYCRWFAANPPGGARP